MRQLTLATGTFETHRKPTRREKFLSDREKVVPWHDLCAVIAPYYPKGENGRPPVGLERMLRIYFLQQWFNLSDPGAEEALYESVSMCRFVGIDLDREPVPDETTILKFRHLLEKHHLGKKLFQKVRRHLESQGVKVTNGTIVDATIISAPSSTKNRDKARDPDMHQTKKGNQWFFGMNPLKGVKAPIGVDSKTKVIHTVVATAANVHDATVLPDLLHGEETRVWGDSAYQGQEAVIRAQALKARDLTNRRYRYKGVVNEVERARNRIKSQIRSRVEHVFGVIKGVFGFVKVRYRGLEKNAHKLFVTCALANLYLVRKRLLRPLRA
ncbi:MAG: IS5 family transposase [Gammaproteobacteria bacterium]|nr:IS5 family transposase [Gammaproteobacteria bacterium]